MIDPSKITNFSASEYELQELILFWICAAGKNGTTMARCLNNLLDTLNPQKDLPFSVLRLMDQQELASELKAHGIGCMTTKSKAMIGVATSDIDLKNCTAQDLESIHGIGMKTARCFIMHSRPDAKVAALDTHILKFLRAQGVDAPLSTPPKKKYLELEQTFLDIAKEQGRDPAELDLEIWNRYAVKPKA